MCQWPKSASGEAVPACTYSLSTTPAAMVLAGGRLGTGGASRPGRRWTPPAEADAATSGGARRGQRRPPAMWC